MAFSINDKIRIVIFVALNSLLSFGDAKGEDWVNSQSFKALNEASPLGVFNFMGSNIRNVEREQLIIKDYLSGLSTRKIVRKYNNDFTKGTVSNALKANGYSLRISKDCCRTHSVNENFFDLIDNEANAYFLGFMYADGNNRPDNAGFSMNLAERDIEILNVFKEKIQSSAPLYFIKKAREKWHNQYAVKVGSKYMSNRLTQLGVMPNKTFKIKFPDFIPDEILHHFIRGYFDGDGSISISQKSGNVSIVGTTFFCLTMKEIIKYKVGINAGIYTPNKNHNVNIDVLRFGGCNQVLKFYNYLYDNATIYLKRKRDKFIDVQNLEKWIPQTNCNICEKKHYGLGYCKSHWRMYKLYGTV